MLEPLHEETNNLDFRTRSYTNCPVQSQKKARSFKFRIKVEEGLFYLRSENKSADQLCSYCTADLCLCFRICRLMFFLCGGLFGSRFNFDDCFCLMSTSYF